MWIEMVPGISVVTCVTVMRWRNVRQTGTPSRNTRIVDAAIAHALHQ